MTIARIIVAVLLYLACERLYRQRAWTLVGKAEARLGKGEPFRLFLCLSVAELVLVTVVEGFVLGTVLFA